MKLINEDFATYCTSPPTKNILERLHDSVRYEVAAKCSDLLHPTTPLKLWPSSRLTYNLVASGHRSVECNTATESCSDDDDTSSDGDGELIFSEYDEGFNCHNTSSGVNITSKKLTDAEKYV